MRAPLVVIALLVTSATAAERTWTNPDGGVFQDPANWDGPVPGAGDVTIFDLDATYGVSFTSAAFGERLLVDAGFVTLALDAFTYDLVGDSPLAPGLVVSNPAGDAGLTVTAGPLLASFAEIAPGPGAGGSVHCVGGDAVVDVAGRLLVGGAGAGSFSAVDGAGCWSPRSSSS